MGLRAAIQMLADDWDGIVALVPDEQHGLLRDLVNELVVEGDPELRSDIAEEIADLLGDLLPVEHAFRRALAVPETRLATSATVRSLEDWAKLTDALRRRGIRPDATADDFGQRVRERLLAAPALTERDLRASGLDPVDPGLVRLDRADGTAQWPAFQFGPDRMPREPVREINAILDAGGDPWGVADWWLGYNGWLRDVPARLIGRLGCQELIDVARHERSEG